MQRTNRKEDISTINPKFNSLLTTVSVVAFLGGFYLVDSIFFASSSWYIRIGVLAVSLAISIFALIKTNHYARILSLFKGARIELSKVFWPKKDELTRTTIMVLVVVSIFAISFSVVDAILTLILKWILQ
ncbi:MAG: preprotein translocase subunit SecE [Candidatus Saccharibacteria bacterium]|nr:preprotein translocase subunit SecE [Candidatus Saccharibacteria bacterium]